MDISHIKSLLLAKGLKTIAELERACGISNGTIGKWESDAYKPTLRSAEKISEYFGVSTDFILGKVPLPCDEVEELLGAKIPADPEMEIICLSPCERELLKRYRKLTPEKQRAIDALMK